MARLVADRLGPRPDGLDFGVAGAGSSNHLLALRVAQAAGITLNHAPYRGACGDDRHDRRGGAVDVRRPAPGLGRYRGGRVRAIATGGSARDPAFPAVPTFKELGVDVVSCPWFGISTPAGTPAPSVERLDTGIRAVLREPEVIRRCDETGGIVGMTPGRTAPSWRRRSRSGRRPCAPPGRASISRRHCEFASPVSRTGELV